MSLLCFLLAIFLGWAGSLEARVIHVPSESPSIQSGIDAAEDGDSVVVDPGKYTEFEIDFLGKAITVMGTDPEDPAVVAATIVDANSLGRVFYFHSGESSTSILTGLTITGGHTDFWGGGIRCTDSSPTIDRNMITGNSADFGGGGIWCENADPVITRNVISDNGAQWGGGGIRCSSSSPVILNNIISGNSADYGGGVDCHYTSSPQIVNNIIAVNAARMGGGIYCFEHSTPAIVNNTIADNSVADFGGGLMSKGFSSPEIVNSILSGNSALEGREIYIGGSEDSSAVRISYSLVEGGLGAVFVEPWCQIVWGDGMIDSDPLFVPGSYTLRPVSPCIDAGDPETVDSCRPPGLRKPKSDMGTFGGEGNCWWPETGIFFMMVPEGSLILRRGETLSFDTYIFNRTWNTLVGDTWLLARLPDQSEEMIPPRLLNFPNPLDGLIFPFCTAHLAYELFIPPFAETGPYSLISRIGIFPNVITDEESFHFHIIEDNYE